MGGLGSGRRPNYQARDKIEAYLALDVNKLYREGCLKPGSLSNWRWTDGRKGTTIILHAETGSLRVSYRLPIDSEYKDVADALVIVYVTCRLGGTRPYFTCPGTPRGGSCGERVAKLYLRHGYFRCRRCHDLTYSSQSEGIRDRLWRRAHKIKKRLGGECDLLTGFPPKPTGMWWRTYEQLRQEAFAAEAAACRSFGIWAEGVLTDIKQQQNKGGRS